MKNNDIKITMKNESDYPIVENPLNERKVEAEHDTNNPLQNLKYYTLQLISERYFIDLLFEAYCPKQIITKEVH